MKRTPEVNKAVESAEFVKAEIDPNTGREIKPVKSSMETHLEALGLNTPCECGENK